MAQPRVCVPVSSCVSAAYKAGWFWDVPGQLSSDWPSALRGSGTRAKLVHIKTAFRWLSVCRSACIQPGQPGLGQDTAICLSQEVPTHVNFWTPSLPPISACIDAKRPGGTLFRDSSFPSATSGKSPTNLEILNQQPSEARPCGPSPSALLKREKSYSWGAGSKSPKEKNMITPS